MVCCTPGQTVTGVRAVLCTKEGVLAPSAKNVLLKQPSSLNGPVEAKTMVVELANPL